MGSKTHGAAMFRVPAASRRLGELRLADVKRSIVAKSLRTRGLRGWQAPTTAALCALWELYDGPFLDVGSNIGVYSLLHASLRPNSTTVAFEPTPDLLERSIDLAELNGLDIAFEGIAVSDHPGEATLYLSKRSDSSNSLEEGFRQASSEVTVPCEPLDEYVARTGTAPAVVKVDVEGHEPAVLRGAGQVLSEVRPIIVIELIEGRPYAAESHEMLTAHGYESRHLVPPPGVLASEAPASLRDWLYWPGPIPRRFDRSYRRWARVVDQCVPLG